MHQPVSAEIDNQLSSLYAHQSSFISSPTIIQPHSKEKTCQNMNDQNMRFQNVLVNTPFQEERDHVCSKKFADYVSMQKIQCETINVEYPIQTNVNSQETFQRENEIGNATFLQIQDDFPVTNSFKSQRKQKENPRQIDGKVQQQYCMNSLKVQGEGYSECADSKIFNNSPSSETNFDNLSYFVSAPNYAYNTSHYTTQNFNEGTLNFSKQHSSNTHIQNFQLTLLDQNEDKQICCQRIFNNNGQQDDSLLKNVCFHECSTLRQISFYNCSPTKENQKQCLQIRQEKPTTIHSWCLSSELDLDNQYQENGMKGNFGYALITRVQPNKPTGLEMLQTREDQINQNTIQQIDDFQQNLQLEMTSNQNFLTSNDFLIQSVEGGVDDSIFNFQKIEENIQRNKEVNYQDKYLIGNSDELLLCEQTHLCGNQDISMNNYDEITSQFSYLPPRYQQHFQFNKREHDYPSSAPFPPHQLVDNQGELDIQPFQQQETNNLPQFYQSPQFDQISQFQNKLFQLQNTDQLDMQINSSSDEQIKIKQQNNQTNKIDNNECKLSTYKVKEVGSRSSQKNKIISEKEYIEISDTSHKTSEETQTNDSHHNQLRIIDQIAHLNKKNIVRNIVRAFKKYFLNKKSQPPVPLQFFPELSFETSKNQFKTYFVNKKFNNSILKQLITDHKYSEVFHYFIVNRSSDYIDHSNIKAKESHEIFINFLVLCFEDTNMLSHLETYSKL